MDWSIVIGAGIAIFSSSITIIISYVFQNKQLEKKRKWVLEDEKHNIRKNIILQRLSKIEEYVQVLVEIYSQIEFRTVANDIKSYEYIIVNEESMFEKIQSNWYLMYCVDYFGDEQLSDYFDQLVDLNSKALEIHIEFSEALETSELDKLKEIRNKLMKLDYRSTYLNMLKRIDHIKEQYMVID